jgi:tellurite resistance protein TerB
MSWLSDQWASAKKNVAKFNNRKFKNAVMAACARAAAANGVIDPGEQQAVCDTIGGIPELQVFDAAELYNLFDEHCKKLNAGPIGKVVANQAIAAVKNDPGAAAMVMTVTMIIVAADGNVDKDEEKVVREICGVLGLDATQFLS